jgi:hypothetical protein
MPQAVADFFLSAYPETSSVGPLEAAGCQLSSRPKLAGKAA